jgi:hypothetical protein
MDYDLQQSDRKKTYEPPQLATISLRPEEAVLGACKTSHGGGQTTTCGIIFGGCQNLGS